MYVIKNKFLKPSLSNKYIISEPSFLQSFSFLSFSFCFAFWIFSLYSCLNIGLENVIIAG
ncbi:hypothetical protein C3H98_08055 [Campylobacter jejuni]|nr:hypothetical protein C3H98_08055 [Campylobacter jejuni]